MKKTLKMNILFICKHNRFRSKVAEAIFKKYNKNKKIKVKSRATNPDYIPVAENTQKALRELGVKRIDRKPKKMEKKDVDLADLIVIVADDVPESLFKNKKFIRWKISDVNQNNYLGILKRSRIIEKRIKNLISMLK